MWLGQQAGARPTRSLAGAAGGDITIGGESAAVFLESEKRQLPCALPGGYFWIPEQEQEALVIRTGDGQRYVLALLDQQEKADLDIAPGEAAMVSAGGSIFVLEDRIKIVTEGCTVTVKDDSVSISGRLFLNGIDVEAAISQGG